MKLGFLICICFFMAFPVMAQDPPGYEAITLRPGGFILSPSLTSSVRYSSNIYASELNETPDQIFTISPSVNLISDWSRHKLAFQAQAESGFYQDESDENYNDFSLRFSGHLDVTDSFKIFTKLNHQKNHYDRQNPNQLISFIEPTTYTTSLGEAGIRSTPNRLMIEISGGMEQTRFDNTRTALDVIINNTDQDRDRLMGVIRLGYALKPETILGIEAQNEKRQYENTLDDEGFNRDSQTHQVFIFFEGNVTPLITATAKGGYRIHQFDDPRFNDLTAPAAQLDLSWQATRYTKIDVSLENDVRESILENVSGVEVWNTHLSFEQYLRRNWIFEAAGSLENQDFDGTSRSDDIYYLSTGLRVYLNRHFIFNTLVGYTKRDSTTAPEYDKYEVTLGLTTRY